MTMNEKGNKNNNLNEKNKKDNQESCEDKTKSGYLFDIMNFDEANEKDEKNERGFFSTLISAIRLSNILIFALPIDTNDLFTKVSLIILSLSLYIFLNIICMYNLFMLHLYIGGDKDPNKKSQPKYNAINMLVSFLLLYLPTIFLKKYISIREFIYDQYKKYDDIKYSDKNFFQQILGYHDIETKISKFINKIEERAFKIFFLGEFSFCLIGM